MNLKPCHKYLTKANQPIEIEEATGEAALINLNKLRLI